MTSTEPNVRTFLRFLTGRRILLTLAPFSCGVMPVLSTSSNHRVWSRFNFQLSFAHRLTGASCLIVLLFVLRRWHVRVPEPGWQRGERPNNERNPRVPRSLAGHGPFGVL